MKMGMVTDSLRSCRKEDALYRFLERDSDSHLELVRNRALPVLTANIQVLLRRRWWRERTIEFRSIPGTIASADIRK